MNKIIIGLIATVVLLGIALVVLNNHLKPQGAGSASIVRQGAPVDRLPALPGALDGQGQAGLMELPSLPPAPVAPGEAETLKEVSQEANIQSKLPPLDGSILRMPVVSQDNRAVAPGDSAAPSLRGSAPAQETEGETVTQTIIQPVIQPETQPTVAPGQPAAALETSTATAVPAASGTPGPAATQEVVPDAPVTPEAARSAEREMPATNMETAAEKPAVKAEKTAEKPAPTTERTIEKPAARAEKPADKTASVTSEKAAGKPAARAKEAPARQPKITVFTRDAGATVRIVTGRVISGYKTMLLDNPDRLVVDITGEYKDLKAPGIPGNSLVSNIRLGHYSDRTRVVIDLKNVPGKHRLILSEDKQHLDVRVDK